MTEKTKTDKLFVARVNAVCERKWAIYCKLRDIITGEYYRCTDAGLRVPRLTWLFVKMSKERYRRYEMPPFVYPKKLEDWLDIACRKCEHIVLSEIDPNFTYEK